MPKATRQTDFCTGHACFPPRAADGGSSDTYVNNLAQMRETDTYAGRLFLSKLAG